MYGVYIAESHFQSLEADNSRRENSPTCTYELLSMSSPEGKCCIYYIVFLLFFVMGIVQSLQFDVEEIITATNNLAKSNEIGKGGYGKVYLARNLRCIGTTAAVKVLSKVNT